MHLRTSAAVLLRRGLVLCLLTLIAACGDDDSGPAGPDPGASDFEWSGPVAAGQQIEIKGVIGGITAAPTTGTDVRVRATKEGQESDPSTVRIEVVNHAGGVTICAVYPDVPGQHPNVCAPGLQGNMSVRDNDVEVTFTVEVPAGVAFVGRTVTGAVRATGLQGNAFGYTVTGNVELSTSRIAEGVTVTGAVVADIGEVTPLRNLAFMTVTGDVSLRLPAATNAHIEAACVHGSMSSDFHLTETAPGVYEGTLGAGGSTLSLATVTGDVTLLRGP